jgi:TPP-dependent pyruvate/acetoin dehydrogenase alpha subunit
MKTVLERFNKTKKFQRRYFSTAGQMPRLLGLAQASKIYRQVKEYPINQISRLKEMKLQGTIGNTSTSEGLFFETINAAGVLQVPLVVSVWDDDYGFQFMQTPKRIFQKF